MNELCKALEQAIKESVDLKLVGSTANAYEMAQLAQLHQPDVIVLDMLMEHLDGLQVLKLLRGKNIEAKCIILSCFYQEDLVRRAQLLGATYFLVKPLPITQLIEKIYSAIAEESKREEKKPRMFIDSKTELWVTDVLNDIGVPTHVAGYRYLRGGIIVAARDLEILNKVTKELYPAIALEFDTSPMKVDRSIRHAVESAWDKKNMEGRRRYLPHDLANRKGKPSNSELISVFADRLRLQQKIWQEEAERECALY